MEGAQGKQAGHVVGMVTGGLGILATVEAARLGQDGGVAVLAGEDGHGGGGSTAVDGGAEGWRRRVASQGRSRGRRWRRWWAAVGRARCDVAQWPPWSVHDSAPPGSAHITS